MAVKSGTEYIRRIDSYPPDVRITGGQIHGPLSEHPAFKGLMSTQAAMYDMQLDPAFRRKLTYPSPLTGDPVGLSFLQPKTKKDMAARRKMMQTWALQHHGFLGRAPDYMNTALMAFAAAAGFIEEKYPEYAANLRRYYEYCREQDITLSHVFVQPKTAHLAVLLSLIEEPTATRIVDKNKDGIVIRGAFLLDTQGATCDEILVYPAPVMCEEEDSPYAFAFAVPSSHPGVRFVCRESFVGGDSAYDYPLSSRFEEMDTLVLFEDALVPWDRVFICGDQKLAVRFFEESDFHTHAGMQIMCKNMAKTEFFLGTAELMVETGGIDRYPQVREMVTELILALETLKSLLLAAERNASRDRWGSMLPDRKPLLAANVYYPKMYPRMIEIIQLLGASGVIMIPGEQDFHSPLESQLQRYLQGVDRNGKDHVRLLRLAWEMSVSAFGGRQTVYERFFFGNAAQVNDRLYKGCGDREEYKKRVNDFLRTSDLR
ncbi:4-hydroxyphenylacetate 3-monooxygenase, oxygenase component [Paenibacillus gansuensis]|uniref:4-hydroxyphenylacetate 3-monooxygenase, oxygenase component n=1 Tax=Paenibacillus gansuensis TaxID=306542 RepID=A0ABW5PLJ7_9BACL